MPRVVSFVVLLAVVLILGAVFFQVMAQFLVPLFLAAVMVVIFKPLHEWILGKCQQRYRIAAALTTLAIVLVFLLPLCGVCIKAITEAVSMVNGDQDAAEVQNLSPSNAEDETHISIDSFQELIESSVATLNEGLVKLNLPPRNSDDIFAFVQEKLNNYVAPILFGGAGILLGGIASLCITIIATYYFFADGPAMVKAIMKMSPMDDAYEFELLDKFSSISRAVVLATLISAAAQGLLAGIGYYFSGIESVFLWTALTAIFAMVPFVGATAIWIPLCLYLYFIVEDHQNSAIFLAIYCGTVVSMSDNLLKPFILHGQANMHPLMALLSVIGGVQVLGPIGILVGPMLVAFFQALLNMLNKELKLLGEEQNGTSQGIGQEVSQLLEPQISGDTTSPESDQAPEPEPETPTTPEQQPAKE